MELNAQAVAEATEIHTARQVASLKGGNLQFERAAVTETVSPNGVVDVEVLVTNNAYVILPTDPDVCFEDTAGYNYEVTIDPEWAVSDSFDLCHTMPEASGLLLPTEEVFQSDFTAPPAEGTFSVDITVHLPGSDESKTITKEVVVSGDSAERPGVPDSPTGGSGGISTGVLAAIIVVAILAILLITM